MDALREEKRGKSERREEGKDMREEVMRMRKKDLREEHMRMGKKMMKK